MWVLHYPAKIHLRRQYWYLRWQYLLSYRLLLSFVQHRHSYYQLPFDLQFYQPAWYPPSFCLPCLSFHLQVLFYSFSCRLLPVLPSAFLPFPAPLEYEPSQLQTQCWSLFCQLRVRRGRVPLESLIAFGSRTKFKS